MQAEPSARAGTRPPVPSVWNIANALTVIRILLVPVFGWLLLADGGNDVTLRFWAFVVFFVAILTDRADGKLARERNLVTDFGKMLDPLADKALTGMAFIGLSIIGELWWWVTIVVVAREVLVTVLRFWVIRRGVIAATAGGKLKTGLQALALMGFILPFRQMSGAWEPIGEVLWWASAVVMAAAVLVTVITGADYVRRALALHRRLPNG